MPLGFEPFDPYDAGSPAERLCSETRPFHVNARPKPDNVRSPLEAGDSTGDNRNFWVVPDGAERLGLMPLKDLPDLGPTPDFRVREAYRGGGIGGRMARWAADYVFTTFPDGARPEGQTREDNVAMRRVFEGCGVGYAISNDDWRRGEVAPVPTDRPGWRRRPQTPQETGDR